jgi:hypothetical protein
MAIGVGALLRGAAPLAAAFALRAAVPALAEARLELWVLGFYGLTLLVELWLLPGLLGNKA